MSPNATLHESESLRIGSFVLEGGTRLRRGGEAVVLPPKEAAFLRMLADANGAPVSKRELLDALWPSLEVTEASLTRCVHQLRLALGDRGRLGAIETLHGRGYRLALKVGRASSAEEGAAPPRVAIVPFSAGRARADRALARGLAGDIAVRLSRIHGDAVAVIDASPARRAGERDLEVVATARRMDVDLLTRGTLRRDGRVICVSLELRSLDGAEASWSHEFASSEAALSSLASEIAGALVKQLGRPGNRTRPRRAAHAPIRSKSYLALMQGHFESQLRTERGIRKGIQHFERAIEWDRGNAAAFAALADSHLMLAMRGYTAPSDVAPVVRDVLERALALDSRLPATLTALAYLRFAVDWQPESALEVLSRAGAAADGHARAHWLYGMIFTACGRFDEAIAAFDRSLDLDPFAPNSIANRAWALAFAARLDEALAAARELAQREPELALAHGVRAVIAAAVGRREEAIRAASLADVHARGDQLALGSAAWALGVVGERERAREIRAALERKAAHRYVSASEIASACVGLGEREEAIAWLERGVAERCMFLPFVGSDLRFAALRDDARFRALAAVGRGRAKSRGRGAHPAIPSTAVSSAT